MVAATLPRLYDLIAEGVTTVEIKSGYGLDREVELRQLRAARSLPLIRPVHVRTTYLGLHALPPEFAANREGYLDLVCRELVPLVAAENLAEAVDAYCEGIAFSLDEISRYFTAAAAAGLACKLHADQLSNGAGRALRPGTRRSRPTIWSIAIKRVPLRWLPPAPSPCFCQALLLFARDEGAPD